MGTINFFNYIFSYPFIVVLWIYQKTLSPDHGLPRFLFPLGFCKFYPTCSAYAIKILSKHGLAGLPKIFKRLLACNPASLGGIDLP